jgi:hypothetical protein
MFLGSKVRRVRRADNLTAICDAVTSFISDKHGARHLAIQCTSAVGEEWHFCFGNYFLLSI